MENNAEDIMPLYIDIVTLSGIWWAILLTPRKQVQRRATQMIKGFEGGRGLIQNEAEKFGITYFRKEIKRGHVEVMNVTQEVGWEPLFSLQNKEARGCSSKLKREGKNSKLIKKNHCYTTYSWSVELMETGCF